MSAKNCKRMLSLVLVLVLLLGVVSSALADHNPPKPPECPKIEKPAPIPDPPCPKPLVVKLSDVLSQATTEIQIEGGMNDIHVGAHRNLQVQVVQDGAERAVVKSVTVRVNDVVIYQQTAAFAVPNDRPKYWSDSIPYTFATAGPVHLRIDVVYENRPGTHLKTTTESCVNNFQHCEWVYKQCEWKWIEGCWEFVPHWPWFIYHEGYWKLVKPASYEKVCKPATRQCVCKIIEQLFKWREDNHADKYLVVLP